MSGNTSPQFTLNGNVSSALVTAGNTKSDGSGTIGTDMFLAFTAGVNGSWVESLRFMPVASVAGTATAATVGRVYMSSISTPGGATSSADTFLIAEVNLPSQTADSSSQAVAPVDVPINERIPAGWTILVSNHAAPAANTNQRATVFGGDY